MIVYHGTDVEKLEQGVLIGGSWVSVDKWCAESYGNIVYAFDVTEKDLIPDRNGLPDGVDTNIFRTNKPLRPIKTGE